jgi:hypothetical protein
MKKPNYRQERAMRERTKEAENRRSSSAGRKSLRNGRRYAKRGRNRSCGRLKGISVCSQSLHR